MGRGEALSEELLRIFLYVGSEWVLWLLLGLSVVALAVIAERGVFFARERVNSETLRRGISATMEKQGAAAALQLVHGRRSMAAHVAAACLRHAHTGPAAVEEQMQSAVKSERLRYERGLAFLGTLGNNAPFVGLFGTVLGIIRAFQDLSANTAAGASVVMAGIAEALVATAIGLLVALPSVAAYNMYMRHIKRTVADTDTVTHVILAHLKTVPPPGSP